MKERFSIRADERDDECEGKEAKSKVSFFRIQKMDCCQKMPPTVNVSLPALNSQIKEIPRDAQQLGLRLLQMQSS